MIRTHSRSLIALSVGLALAAPLALLAGSGDVALASGPTQDQSTTARMVHGLLSNSRYAYRPRPADDAMSGDIFERFLEALDGNKQFFNAADIARFEPYRHRMADAVRSGDPAPAFAMFSVANGVLVLLGGISVASSVVGFLALVTLMADGAILMLAYGTPLKERFR